MGAVAGEREKAKMAVRPLTRMAARKPRDNPATRLTAIETPSAVTATRMMLLQLDVRPNGPSLKANEQVLRILSMLTVITIYAPSRKIPLWST